MNSSKTPESSLFPYPSAPSCDAELPVHLRGSRDAIFHLLRGAPAANASGQTRSANPPVANLADSDRTRKPAATLPADRANVQDFFQEDQFVFHSAEARGVAVRNHTVGSKLMVAS